MIGRIQGKLLEISDNFLLIDVSGVAYEVEATSAALALAAAPGADVTLFTHFVVREDAQLLYGFGSKVERDVFRELIRISGVGPKMALAIVSGLTLEALAEAVRGNDVGLLTRVQGVGKKTAERLLVELRDKLGNLHVVVRPVSVGADQGAIREAEDALISLGYRPAEAQRAVAAIVDESALASGEDLLRAALKQIARQAETGAARSDVR
jgi:Holliday junction DNA helicase RuvA